jgi:ribonuclease P protein component
VSSRFFFRKEERLCSRKAIELLFREKRQVIFKYPLKFSWVFYPHTSSQPGQILITVSRKKFRLAAQRNRIKRQLREVYRKNKHRIYDYLSSEDKKAILLLSFVGEKDISCEDLEQIFLKIADQLILRGNK